MKILQLVHSLDIKTGIGAFTSQLTDTIQNIDPSMHFETLTSNDYLRFRTVKIIQNLRILRCAIKNTDIIHAVDAYPYGVMAAFVNIGVNKPIVITAIGSGSLKFLGLNSIRSILLRWSYSKAEKVVAISSYVARKIEENVMGAQIEVINPGVDVEFFKEVAATGIDEIIGSLEPYLLTVGEMKPRKGYEKSLEVFKTVSQVHSINYVIVASNNRNLSYRAKINTLITNLGLEDKIKFFSDLAPQELRALYQGAMCYLLLPQNVNGDVEGYGMSVVEAAASGVPAIVAKDSGADDTVINGKTGYLVESYDNQKIVDRIQFILQNSDLRAAFSEASKKFAEEKRWKYSAIKYKTLYEKI